MKTAIITDTNSGMTPEDASEHGIIMIPMPVIINNKEYFENVNLTSEDFYAFQAADAEIHTSQPSIGDMMDLWSETLKEYDKVVYIPMSSGLSGTCASAKLAAEDFDGKVEVIDNQRVSVTLRQSVLDAKAMADHGAEPSEIRRILEETRFDSHIYIMLDTLKYLKKGGRITPAAAMIAGVLNLKPVLQIQGEKLDAFSKCRGINNAKKIMTNIVSEGIEKEFGGLSANPPGAWIGIAHTRNLDAALAFKEETMKHFPGFDVHVDELPLSIASHLGPGTLALTCTKVLPEGVQY